MDSANDFSSEQFHVAQQSRREKLRVQPNHSPARSDHEIAESYAGRFELVQPLLSQDLLQVGDDVRNCASQLSNPAVISSELLLSFSNNNFVNRSAVLNDQVSMVAKSSNMASSIVHQGWKSGLDNNLESCGVWKSVGPSSNSGNWNAECATENSKNVSVAVPSDMCSADEPVMYASGRPQTRLHYGEINLGPQFNYDRLCDEVTTAVVGLQPTSTTRGTTLGTYSANTELVRIGSYGDQSSWLRFLGSSLWNGDMSSLHNRGTPMVVDPQAQGLSLSLGSNPATSMMIHDSQYGNDCIPHSIPLRMVADNFFQESKPFSGTDSLRTTSLAHGNCIPGNIITSMNYHRQTGPLGPFTGYAIILKSSRFLKPAQQLLDDYCGVIGKFASASAQSQRNVSEVSDLADAVASIEREVGTAGDFSTGSASTCQDSGEIIGEGAACSSGESQRPEYLLKKAKLLYMLEEVSKRYKQYYQQMQMVVSAFDSVAGLAAATPYISSALKTVSRHFNYLKNAISEQLRHIKTFLGDSFSSPSSGVRNKEDSNYKRLKYLDHSFQKRKPSRSSMGLFEPQQHIWRPQRGLPERAVSVLRAWLFEHFLHPYPTDTDKHMLATQTGLTRSQVSNWFINARVRLWKPMVEEIHMLETKGLAETDNNSVENEKAMTPEINTQLKGDRTIGTSVPSMNTVCPGTGALPAMEDIAVVKQWNHKKQSQTDSHITSSMDGGLISFSLYDQPGHEIGGMGPISLTLGLRQSADQMYRVEGSHHLQQQQGHIRHHFNGFTMQDFAG